MDNEYYILEAGDRVGPFSLRNLLARPLEPTDVVVLPGDTLGKAAHEMPEFYDYFKSEGIYYPTSKIHQTICSVYRHLLLITSS